MELSCGYSRVGFVSDADADYLRKIAWNRFSWSPKQQGKRDLRGVKLFLCASSDQLPSRLFISLIIPYRRPPITPVFQRGSVCFFTTMTEQIRVKQNLIIVQQRRSLTADCTPSWAKMGINDACLKAAVSRRPDLGGTAPLLKPSPAVHWDKLWQGMLSRILRTSSNPFHLQIYAQHTYMWATFCQYSYGSPKVQ